MNKKIITAILVLCMIAVTVCFSAESQTNNETSDKTITVFLNGIQLYFDIPPQMVNDRVMVPIRKIFEALGADVDWDDAAQTITAVKNDLVVKLEIDNTAMFIIKKKIILDVPPMLLSDRTLVPVRAVAESFNAKVNWDEPAHSVLIDEEKVVSSPEPLSTPAATDTPEISPDLPITENTKGEYKIETVIDKQDIKKIQYLVYANDILYFLDNNILKTYDLSSKTLSTISDFKDLQVYDETDKKTYTEYLPKCLVYNKFTDSVMMFGVFQKTDGRAVSRFAVYTVESALELINTYVENPLKNYTNEPRACFIDADNVYCWDYIHNYRSGLIDSGIVKFNLKNGNSSIVRLGQDRSFKYRINIFVNSDEAYAHYCIKADSYNSSSSNIGMRIERIGSSSSQYIAKVSINSLAECSYDGNMYVLAEDGAIYKYIGTTIQREIYVNKDAIPKDYKLSEYNVRFWQFDKNSLPVWYDDSTKTIKRIVPNT